MPEIQYLRTILAFLRAHVAELRRQGRHAEDGYSTETIIVIALLAAMALVVVGVIVSRVKATANKIKTE
jgi:hypothetical protein